MSDSQSEDSGNTCHRGMHWFQGAHTLEFMSRGADYRPVQFDRCLASCLIYHSRRFTRSREVSADKSGTVWLVFGGVEEEAGGSNWYSSYKSTPTSFQRPLCALEALQRARHYMVYMATYYNICNTCHNKATRYRRTWLKPSLCSRGSALRWSSPCHRIAAW